MQETDLLERRSTDRADNSISGRPPALLVLGLALICIAAPLAFVPATRAPFVDAKLVLLLGGALALWGAHRAPSPLAVPAVAWVGTVALAGVVGVDPWWSLVGPENTANGALLLGASAFVLVAGAAVPASVRTRIPLWLVATSAAVGAVSLLYRLWPGAFDLLIPGLSFEGGTLGHPVYLAGFSAVGVIAAVSLRRLRPVLLGATLVLLSSALALSTKRVGWIALAVGLAVVLWRVRPPRTRAFLIVGVVAGTLIGWTLVDAFVAPETPLSGASRFAELKTDSARARVTALAPMSRAWTERPMLGWGPGNVWGAYVSSATSRELEISGRGLGDAHNILVEAAVTTGAIGLGALLALAGLTVREMRKGPSTLGWAAGGAAALGLYHLLQPNNVALTPLLFLLAGLACRPPPEDGLAREPPPAALRRVARGVAGVLLAGALVVAGASMGASVLEQHGRTYAAEWALRASMDLVPGRVTSAEALALHLALDGRSGDRAAGREAADLSERIVRLHPWNPGVRLVAADVHLLLRDPEGAIAWVQRHLARFPTDVIPRPPDDPEALLNGLGPP